MNQSTDLQSEVEALGNRLAAANSSRWSVATAESLTGGQLASAFAAAPAASEWYRGGIVAYQASVKHRVLGTPPGPVVNAETALAMATSVSELLGADYAVGVTGVGGPGPEEDQPAGTVFLAVSRGGEPAAAEHHRFIGDPLDVMRQTISAAVRMVTACIESDSVRDIH